MTLSQASEALAEVGEQTVSHQPQEIGTDKIRGYAGPFVGTGVLRRLPNSVFEVGHSTDFQNSLLKFLELQDFNLSLRIVAPEARRAEFHKKLSYEAFRPIQNRVNFVSYETVSDMHTKAHELEALESRW